MNIDKLREKSFKGRTPQQQLRESIMCCTKTELYNTYIKPLLDQIEGDTKPLETMGENLMCAFFMNSYVFSRLEQVSHELRGLVEDFTGYDVKRKLTVRQRAEQWLVDHPKEGKDDPTSD